MLALPDRRRGEGGLTLIEVMVALAVLVILTGGLFMVVQTSLQSVMLLDESASREDEISNTIDVFRHGLRNMPATARMVVTETRVEEEPALLWIVRDAPNLFAWLPEDEPAGMIVILAFRSDPENPGKQAIFMKRIEAPETMPGGEIRPNAILEVARGVSWLFLVGDFDRLGARFYDGQASEWQEEWEEAGRRPALVELLLETPKTRNLGDAKPVLWVPPLKVVEASR